MSDFVMPSLGADMESAKVTEWLVKPGSKVKKGDVVAVVETHKGAIEVEIFQDGVISELCVKEGEDVPVGALLARLTAPGEAPARATAPRRHGAAGRARRAAAGRGEAARPTATAGARRPRPPAAARAGEAAPAAARAGARAEGDAGGPPPGRRTRHRSCRAHRNRHRRLGDARRCRSRRRRAARHLPPAEPPRNRASRAAASTRPRCARRSPRR